MNTKTFGVGCETTGGIYKCVIYKKEWDTWNLPFPKMGKNREGETQKWSEQVLIFTPGLFGPQPPLQSQSTEALSQHTDGIIHTADIWLLINVDTTPPAVDLIRQEEIRNLRQSDHELTAALQSLRTSPSRLLFSILPFLGRRKQLRKPPHRSSAPSSIWRVPYQQSCTPPLEKDEKSS